jgi:outer membrane immunogenic protein
MFVRRIALALAFLATGGAAAMAADMPVKAPVAAPALATNWTGFYVNAGYGYGIWSADTTTVNPITGACLLCFNQVQGGKGWLGVVGIGYDRQLTANIVAGVFADFNFADLKGTIQDQFPFFAGDISEKWAWAAGARIGWLMTPDILAYVNGGYTSARFSSANMVFTFNGAASGFTTPAFTAHGWFIGGGTEMAMHSVLGYPLGPGWFWRNEYRYASYRNQTLPDTLAAPPTAAASINFEPTVQTITSQLVYKFNTGGPSYPAMPLPPANWSGFYVNAGIGYGAWAADTTTTNPIAPAPCDFINLCVLQVQGGKGWLGVVGAGFDIQATPKIVLGAFGDFNVSALKGTIQDQNPFLAGDIKQTGAWAAGIRAGWLVTPQTLSYVNGGYTGARFSGTNMVVTGVGTPTAFTTPAFNTHGWFLGGGVEAAIMPSLFWRNEYRLAHYNDVSISDTSAAPPAVLSNINFKTTVQTITTQLVYKFNWTP